MMAGDEVYDDDVTSGPLPDGNRSGNPPGRTAVGAGEEGGDPVEKIMRQIDRLTLAQTIRLRELLRLEIER